MAIIRSSYKRIDIDIYSDKKFSDLKYTYDIALLCEDQSKLQVSLDHLNEIIGMFEMGFAPPNCKRLFLD